MAYAYEEVKSGVLVTVTIALLLLLTFRVGDFSKEKTEAWKIQFGYVGGLKKNAPVYFAGHEVGKVEQIKTLRGEEKPILVTIRVPDSLELREDSHAFIDTLGLMGEKFVELTPGSSGSPILSQGSTIPSIDPVRMYLLIQKMDGLADRMDKITTDLEPLFENYEGDVSEIVANFRETSVNLRDMTRDLKLHPWKLFKKK